MTNFAVFMGWFSLATAVFFLVVVLGGYYVFWQLKPPILASYKVRNLPINAKVVRRELLTTAQTFLIILVMASVVYLMERSGHTLIYHDVNRYGLGYHVAAFFMLNLMQDAYFYWTHRALHDLPWLARFHRVHHNSYQPSPLSAFSFHWVEGVISYLFFPIVIVCVPLHPYTLIAFFSFLMILTVVGHLGFELYPRNMFELPFFKHFNSATHHDLHHERYHCNFGLYYSFWDKWCGTLSDGFEAKFLRAASGAPFESSSDQSSRSFSATSESAVSSG